MNSFLLAIAFCISLIHAMPMDSNGNDLADGPQISSYEYTPTETGYTYNYRASTSVTREETLEVLNKGTPDEETVITGEYTFRAEDGYKYYIQYKIDKTGSHVDVTRTAIHRIPPNALKSLVG